MNSELVKKQDVFAALIAVGIISSSEFQQRIEPIHGSCCTCQICGRIYDECVCTSNDIVCAINEIKTIDDASAPELLAALEAITNIRWGYDGDCGAVEIAESAIAKARGL